MKVNHYRKFLLPLLLISSLFSVATLTGCDNKEEPVEEIVDDVDEAAQDAKRAVEDAVD